MKFYVYSIYDPEVESFDSRFNLGPLAPTDMKEQYKRAWIKMEEKDKAFMLGKVAVCLGEFDDETGKIEQGKMLEIYRFEEIKVKSTEGEDEAQTDA